MPHKIIRRKMEIEKRSINEPIQMRQTEDNKTVFYGYALRFDEPSPVRNGWYEVIRKGALTQDIIDKSDIRALFNHNPDLVLARKNDKVDTLKLTLDDKGLYYEFEDPQTMLSDDLKRHMKLGNIDQSSFAFTLEPDGDVIREDDNGVIVRELTKFKELYDVSPVTYAFYPTAISGVKERVEALLAEHETEEKSGDDEEAEPAVEQEEVVETHDDEEQEQETEQEQTDQNSQIIDDESYRKFIELERVRYKIK